MLHRGLHGDVLERFALGDKINQYHTRHVQILMTVFFAEMLASALITFPILLIEKDQIYSPFREGWAVSGAVYCAVWLVYPISGAHLNPLVTLAAGISRRINIIELPIYWGGQMIGVLISMTVASKISPFFDSNDTFGMTLPHQNISVVQAFFIEGMISFLMVSVVIAGQDELRTEVWTMGDGVNVSITYMLIFLLNTVVFVPLTGASMNPFRSLVACILKNNFSNLWIYFVGPIFGCVTAVLFFETFLSGGACIYRTHALFCDKNFNREIDYTKQHRPTRKKTGKPLKGIPIMGSHLSELIISDRVITPNIEVLTNIDREDEQTNVV